MVLSVPVIALCSLYIFYNRHNRRALSPTIHQFGATDMLDSHKRLSGMVYFKVIR